MVESRSYGTVEGSLDTEDEWDMTAAEEMVLTEIIYG